MSQFTMTHPMLIQVVPHVTELKLIAIVMPIIRTGSARIRRTVPNMGTINTRNFLALVKYLIVL